MTNCQHHRHLLLARQAHRVLPHHLDLPVRAAAVDQAAAEAAVVHNRKGFIFLRLLQDDRRSRLIEVVR